MEAEFARPQWIFGANCYGFVSADRAICAVNRSGVWELLDVDLKSGRWTALEIGGYSAMDRSDLRIGADQVLFEAGGPTEPNALLRLDLESGQLCVLRCSSTTPVDPGYLSIPETIEFPTEGGLTAHAFFYRPQNRDFAAPEGAKPPLLLKSHGGPTAATSNALDLEIQFWTSRGFAVVDVNYGGSTGFGREYRRRLERNWGVVDVDDCVNAALYLVDRGLVDERQLAIDGGSAGGYTTLAVLTFRDIFSAGASYYGVSDLESLARDTHKFESRYLDSLVGPYPKDAAVYRERSPINFTERLSSPIIFLQGLEDRIVPPDQAETMFNSVRAKGIPTAYLTFPGEQHGFRQAGNIKRALEAELYFFSRLFGFEPADEIAPVISRTTRPVLKPSMVVLRRGPPQLLADIHHRRRCGPYPQLSKQFVAERIDSSLQIIYPSDAAGLIVIATSILLGSSHPGKKRLKVCDCLVVFTHHSIDQPEAVEYQAFRTFLQCNITVGQRLIWSPLHTQLPT